LRLFAVNQACATAGQLELHQLELRWVANCSSALIFQQQKNIKLTYCIKSYVGSTAQIFGVLALSAYSLFRIEEFWLYA